MKFPGCRQVCVKGGAEVLVPFPKFQFQLAITEFDSAITQHPDAAGAYFGRGLVKYKNRDVNGAVSDLNKAKELGFEFTSDVLESLN